MSNTNTYEITTRAGKTHRVEDSLSHPEAGRAIINSTREQSSFAKDMAHKAVHGRQLSELQLNWLHVLASWATAPEPSTRGPQGELPRIAELFSTAIDAGKRFPRVRLALPSGDPLVLKANGKGRVNITDGKPYGESQFFGSITIETGTFRPGRDDCDSVRTMLSALDADPAAIASQYGIATGQCCFCGLALTDERSIKVGYGPICAGKHGLPWGDRPTVQEKRERGAVLP